MYTYSLCENFLTAPEILNCRWVDGGSLCRMSIKNKCLCLPVEYKKVPFRMSLKPKKGCVAVSIA